METKVKRWDKDLALYRFKKLLKYLGSRDRDWWVNIVKLICLTIFGVVLVKVILTRVL